MIVISQKAGMSASNAVFNEVYLDQNSNDAFVKLDDAMAEIRELDEVVDKMKLESILFEEKLQEFEA